MLLMASVKPPKAELILRWFEAVPGDPGEGQGEKAQGGFKGLGESPPSPPQPLGLLALPLAFPYTPWNCLKPP